MDQQTPISFTNRNGLRLFGVMHTPQGARTDLAVILLSPGVKMRVGPQGLYRRMTDEFVRMGIPVLRFDFFGLGDSEGTLREELLRDVYNHIEVGRFVDDTIDAMDWMGKEYGTKRFILSGLCGGAITGLLAGGRDARVAGLLGLGITAVLAASSADASLYMTAGQLQATRRKYIGRLLSPQAWLRLLTLKSDYRLIWRFLSEPVKQRIAKPSAGEAAPPPEKDNANPLFPPAFFNMLSTKRPMLLVFGGTDRLQWEFEEKFVARHREKLAALPALYDVHVIEHANHVLSLTEWQRELLDVSNRWLTKHYASDLAVRPTLQPAESPA